LVGHSSERPLLLQRQRLGVAVHQPPRQASAAAVPGRVGPMKRVKSREVLVEAARRIAARDRQRLLELKARAREFERADFVWHALLTAFSTWGASRGWDGLVNTPANYARVTFEALAQHAPEDRAREVDAVFRLAGLRMPSKKARLLCSNFDRIVGMGGVAAARDELVAAPGRSGKVAFLRTFDGIGPKYARNVMMDVHHEDFRESIAIDSRIIKVTRAAGERFDTYDEHERYLLAVARDAGLTGWELDRLLYWNTESFLDALRHGCVPSDQERAAVLSAYDQVREAVELLDRDDVPAARKMLGAAAENLAASLGGWVEGTRGDQA
jgi:hypothetical protein